MKKNDIKALAEKSLKELQEMLTELEVRLAKARLNKAAKKPIEDSLPSQISDDIARIKTVMTEKRIATALEAQIKESSAPAAEKDADQESAQQ